MMPQGDMPLSPVYSHHTEQKSEAQSLGSPSMLIKMELFASSLLSSLSPWGGVGGAGFRSILTSPYHGDVHVLGLGTSAPKQLHAVGFMVRGRGEHSWHWHGSCMI